MEELNEAQTRANRFHRYGQAYFRFITTPGMDPTNNVAEQAIRFIIIGHYATQGTRSPKSRQANERLWSVIGTCALQGRSAYQLFGYVRLRVRIRGLKRLDVKVRFESAGLT